MTIVVILAQRTAITFIRASRCGRTSGLDSPYTPIAPLTLTTVTFGWPKRMTLDSLAAAWSTSTLHAPTQLISGVDPADDTHRDTAATTG